MYLRTNIVFIEYLDDLIFELSMQDLLNFMDTMNLLIYIYNYEFIDIYL